MQQAARL